MIKTEVKITGTSHPRWIKTAVNGLTTLESIQRTKMKPRKVESLALRFISGILIAFFSIVGCSDMPYTGSVLTTDTVEVDQYMMSPNEELVCLQNGTDSECLTLIPKPEEKEKADSVNGPIIHIHPEELVYIFYHEGKEIVRVEKVTDTTNIAETLTETKADPSSQAGGQSGGTGTAGNDPDNNNNNPDGTQQSAPPPQQQDPDDDTQQSAPPPPPPPQNNDQSGGVGTAGDDSEDDNNPDNTPDPPPPPPPQQTNNQPRGSSNPNNGNSNPNNGGNNNPDSTVSHRTPNAMYYDHPGEWSVTIFYPDNYRGPKTEDDYGFSISSSNGTIGNKEVSNRGVRFHVVIGEGTLYLNVVWKTGSTYWDGDQPSRRYLLQARPGGTHRIQVEME